tara:strand:+ start:212 stop:661 length:450 start_codon:yes stop_codon:yes gene_type:complete
MGTTTFSGPIKAGSIKDTTGTTVGSNVANIGSVVMAQSAAITEAAASADVGIVIPANSQIVEIHVLVQTAWDGGTNTLDVGDRSDTDLFVDGLPCTAVGNHRVTAATTGTEASWRDVGTSDVGLSVDSVAGGNGAGVLTVSYIQNNNLS